VCEAKRLLGERMLECSKLGRNRTAVLWPGERNGVAFEHAIGKLHFCVLK